MTIEEQAENYASKIYTHSKEQIKAAYIKGYEEREKENTKLHEKIGLYQKGMFTETNKRDIKIRELEEKIIELEEENKMLHEFIHDYREQIKNDRR